MHLFKITDKNRKWWILIAMTIPMSMVFIDITVLPVALPTIQRELSLSSLGLQWVVNAYTFLLAVLVLGSGRLGDMWGLKKAFCLGLGLFTFASFLCGMSHSEIGLILSRGLQGIGASFLVPSMQGILYSTFPPHQRGKALGLLISISAVFLSIGPLLGGTLTEYLSWRYVFWINIPISLIGFLLAIPIVPNIEGIKGRFDFSGFFTLSISMAALIIALMEVQSWGWSSPLTLSLLALGILLPFVFFRAERNVPYPIVDFSIIFKRSFMAGAGAIFCSQFLSMVIVFWAIYFQEILLFSPIVAGLYAFLSNAPVLIGAPFGGYLVDRFGPKPPVMLGFGFIFLSLLCLIYVSITSNAFLLLFALIPFGLGASLIYTPSYVSMLHGVPASQRGVTAGFNTSLRQFSGTLGLAIFGTIFTTLQTIKLTHLLHENSSTAHLHAVDLEGVLSHSPAALHSLSSLSSSQVDFVLSSARSSFINAFVAINIGAALVAFIGFFIAWRLMKQFKTPQ